MNFTRTFAERGGFIAAMLTGLSPFVDFLTPMGGILGLLAGLLLGRAAESRAAEKGQGLCVE